MQKFRLFTLVFCVMLSVSTYSQTESDGEFFLGAGLQFGIFSDKPFHMLSDFQVEYLNTVKVSGNWETPFGPGNIAFGLEGGYASGSRFGGKGAVDFIPLRFITAYTFSPFIGFSFGPSLKLGAMILNGPDWFRAVPVGGARFEIELGYKLIPLSLYGSAGFDYYPLAKELGILPVAETGLRFRKIKRKQAVSTVPLRDETVTGSQEGSNSLTQSGQSSAGASQGQTPAGGTAPAQATATPQGTPPAQTGQAAPAGQEAQTAQSGQAAQSGQSSAGASQGQTPAAGTAPAQAAATPQGTPPAQTGQTTPAGQESRPDSLEQGLAVVLKGGVKGILRSVFFEPDTAVLIESSRAALETVGRELTADPSLHLLLRAYTANFGTYQGRELVSERRAEFCDDYFTQRYGISSARISNELYGSDRSPEQSTTEWGTHRCVELIIFKD
jgi:outer membrane protein OmpA-like peptidoglycan-associated protein